MKIIFSELLKDSLEYWPVKFTFSDIDTSSQNELPFLNLFNHFLGKNLLNKGDYMDFIDGMAWCIHNAFAQKAMQIYEQNGSCDFVHQKDLDVNYIIKRFKEHMKASSWKEFLKKENVEIVYDIENCKIS